MKAFLATVAVLSFPAPAFAVFSVAPLPEPGVLELLALVGVAIVASGLIRPRK